MGNAGLQQLRDLTSTAAAFHVGVEASRCFAVSMGAIVLGSLTYLANSRLDSYPTVARNDD
jgi:hypothetical protein